MVELFRAAGMRVVEEGGNAAVGTNWTGLDFDVIAAEAVDCEADIWGENNRRCRGACRATVLRVWFVPELQDSILFKTLATHRR